MTYKVTTQMVMDDITNKYGQLIAPECPYDGITQDEWSEAWADFFEDRGVEPTEDETLGRVHAIRERRANADPYEDYEEPSCA